MICNGKEKQGFTRKNVGYTLSESNEGYVLHNDESSTIKVRLTLQHPISLSGVEDRSSNESQLHTTAEKHFTHTFLSNFLCALSEQSEDVFPGALLQTTVDCLACRTRRKSEALIVFNHSKRGNPN